MFYDPRRAGLPSGAQQERMMEAAPGFEPGIKDLQSHALPLGYAALTNLYFTTYSTRLVYPEPVEGPP